MLSFIHIYDFTERSLKYHFTTVCYLYMYMYMYVSCTESLETTLTMTKHTKHPYDFSLLFVDFARKYLNRYVYYMYAFYSAKWSNIRLFNIVSYFAFVAQKINVHCKPSWLKKARHCSQFDCLHQHFNSNLHLIRLCIYDDLFRYLNILLFVCFFGH